MLTAQPLRSHASRHPEGGARSRPLRRCLGGLGAALALAALLAAAPPAMASKTDSGRIEELMRRASGEGSALTDDELQELLAALPPDEIEVNLVMVPVVVLDAKGHPVAGLALEDFEVTDSGRPQPISWFSEEGNRPLRIALLIDVFGSMDHPIVTDRLREALLPLMRRLRLDMDRLLLLSFAGSGVTQHDEWNRRPLTTLHRALTIPRGGKTALQDALEISARLMPKNPHERHAIVLVSDGLDNGSQSTTRQVIDAARSVDSPVYVIALGDEARKIHERLAEESPLQPLRHVAEQTGARFFVISDAADAAAAADALVADLRHQYVLAFRPESRPDGQFRPLIVRIDRPGLEIRTRTGYK